MSSSYIIQGGETGRARLSVLSQAMAPWTGGLLDRAGSLVGLRVLDAGCGGGDVSRDLAVRVGPTGRVVGVDGDAVKIAAAEAADEGLANLAFHLGDATSPPGGPFDVIYARFLLSHLTDVPAALAAFRGHLRLGGRVVIEDVDFSGHFVAPPLQAFDDYVAWYREAAWLRGADADIGPRLPGLIAAAGFVDVDAEAVNPAGLRGPVKQLAALTLAGIAEAVIAEDIAGRDRVERAVADLQAAADDPSVFMSLPRVVQVIARAP
ncbi:MAG: methyltransferase domain-containing protein [Pseudomonadota bacterium]